LFSTFEQPSMAAVGSPPPAKQASPNGQRRKPAPQVLSPAERYDWGENAKPLPGVPAASDSPRLRQSPISPVRVNFQPNEWHRASQANIETHIHPGHAIPAHVLNRALPQSPQAPTPPPHTPIQYESAPSQAYQSSDPDLVRQPGTPNGVRRPYPPESASIMSYDLDNQSMSDQSGRQLGNRNSRESDTTESTSRQQTSIESSATTSASSVSGVLDVSDNQDKSVDATEGSIVEDSDAQPEPVQPLQYAFLPRPSSMVAGDPKAQSNPNLSDAGSINRHLTPTNTHRRSSLPRPHSAYSAYSDYAPRGRSPYLSGSQIRAPSAHSSRRSPDVRPSSFVELLNQPYPQPAPAPITLDNSQLRSVVGNNASLLSTEKTLEMYRQNVKKTNDYSTLYSFAVFLIATAQEQGFDPSDPKQKSQPGSTSPHDLVREARAILQKLSNNGYPFAQYYLADGYASGLFSKGKEDYNQAFPLFVLAAKHGHAESAYRTALCYEFGWGCRKDPTKAVQYLRTAASKRHPGAMTRLGKACLSGDLGEKRYREGIKWLKLAAEAADTIYNAAPYHLGCLYETGYGDDIFKDESYAAELFTQAADLGHPEANYRMGDAYEHGKLNCPRDPALSVHFYTGAAERGHAAAMMGLCAWYLLGAEPVLEKDEEEAYEWAKRSAELGKFAARIGSSMYSWNHIF
jgi:TPR repeat protein